jgi:hypothetical protein
MVAGPTEGALDLLRVSVLALAPARPRSASARSGFSVMPPVISAPRRPRHGLVRPRLPAARTPWMASRT